MNDTKSLNSRAFKAGTFYIICQFLVRGISFLTTPIYTRLLSVDEYGIVRTYESWLLILVPIVTLGLYRSVEVAKHDYKDKYSDYVSSIIKIGFGLSAFFAMICLLFWDCVSELFNFTNIMQIYMLFYIFAEFSIMCFQRREKQLMRYKYSTMLTMLTVVSGTVISLIALGIVKLHNDNLDMVSVRIIGYYTPVIVGGLVVALVMILQGKSNEPIKDWKYGLVFSIPLIAEVLSIQIMNQADKIMINNMVGSVEAGIYSLATTVSYIIWIIEEAVWGAWQPWLYEKIERNETEDIVVPWKKMMHIFGLLTLLVVIVAPEIILILGGAQYKDAVYIVTPLVIGTLFRFFSYSFSAVQNYEKKTGYVAFGTIIAVLLNIVLNYIGICKWGYAAAAYATAFSYLVLLVLQAVLEKWTTGKSLFSPQYTIGFSVLCFLLCHLTTCLYSVHLCIRYLVAVIVILYEIIKNRTYILNIIKKKMV